MGVSVLHGNNLDVLPTLADGSIDAIVTDPPYELGFMGKQWDGSGIAYSMQLWAECLRVLKPGGHLLAFGGTRTYHRMTAAIEDAGFEVRDSLHWIYGSGFPKSLDVSKAIDKAAGAERPREVAQRRAQPSTAIAASGFGADGWAPQVKEAATAAPQQWEGWGTALKPAHEPIVLARKPLVGTVAANVLAHGTGALNIDGCRVANIGAPIARVTGKGTLGGTSDGYDRPWKNDPSAVAARQVRADAAIEKANTAGRWPANVIFDEAAGAELDAHTPEVARFFYCPKPSRAERNAGLDGLPVRPKAQLAGADRDGPLDDVSERFRTTPAANHHPTVKPVALMRWLVRLITPPGGTVLDPFAGSGTTLMAAVLEGFDAIGIEMTDEYLPLIEGRVAWATAEATSAHPTLFDGDAA